MVRLATFVLAFATGVGYLRSYSIREVEPNVARRAAWVVEALVIALVLSGFAVIFEFQVHVMDRSSALVQWPHAVFLPMALISFVGSLAVSVFYRGAIAPSLIIARTTVIGGVGLLLTCLFLVGEELMSNLVADWFGLPSLFGAVVTGLMAAGAFAPLYRWANRIVSTGASDPAS